jgi:hypothetical protein
MASTVNGGVQLAEDLGEAPERASRLGRTLRFRLCSSGAELDADAAGVRSGVALALDATSRGAAGGARTAASCDGLAAVAPRGAGVGLIDAAPKIASAATAAPVRIDTPRVAR